jgi:hypothetical protein
MIRRNNIPWVLILLMLTSCSTELIELRLQATSRTSIATPLSHLPESTITATPGVNFVQQCLQLEPKEVALKDVSSGVVLLFPYLLDIETNRKNRIPAQQAKSGYYGGGQVSPNRKMYAYTEDILNDQLEIINNILWVVDAQAGLLSKISFNRKDYLGQVRWLDNERVLLDTAETDDDGSLLLVNPFTYEQRIIANELPMLYTYNGVNGPLWRVEYSPDLEWVAYLNIDSIIVRDIVTKQTLWQSTGGDGGKPVWSPDGQQVAVISLEDGQLYLVSRSGEAKPVLPDGISKHALPPLSWSPDGQSIAFWNNDSLTLYSKQNNQVVDLCVPGNKYARLLPVWSPDGQQIFVDFTALVDLQKKVAYTNEKITDSRISDWMNSLP